MPYDGAGNLENRTEGLNTLELRVISFTYESMNRKRTETDGTGATTETRYDAAGNVAKTIDATGIVVTRAYDERNHLVGHYPNRTLPTGQRRRPKIGTRIGTGPCRTGRH